MSMTIKLEVTAGSSIENAFAEAIRVAGLLQVTVEFSLNGVCCWGVADGDVQTGVDEYLRVIKLGGQYKYAHSRNVGVIK